MESRNAYHSARAADTLQRIAIDLAKDGSVADGAYVYILAGNRPTVGREPLYVGSTTDLARRVWEHRTGEGSKHTARYRIGRLLWYEVHDSLEEARLVEYRLKRWRREWKDRLIDEMNPERRDLYAELE